MKPKECKFRWWNFEGRMFVCDACGFADKLDEQFELSQVHRTCPIQRYGLGDAAADLFEATGIAAIAKYLAGGDCDPCKQRQEKLNNLGEKIGL